ncbi:MAG: alkaline phosphatase D family protein [Opitutaceae bacterium]
MASRTISPRISPLPGLVILLGILGTAPGQAGHLISGPMLGYVEHREALIWLEVEDAETVSLACWPEERPDKKTLLEMPAPPPHPAGGSILKFRPGLLEPGTTYRYTIAIDGEDVTPAPGILQFRTRTLWEWRTDAPDFSFLAGSCAYVNEPVYDRPGTPYGKGTGIFLHMAQTGADFMIWLGDNVYLREVDLSSESGIWYRYQHDRRIDDLQPLLRAMSHRAIWDDHDYGPDNSNRSYQHKATSRAVFDAYWGNPTAGQPGDPGIYHKFDYGDVGFILLDNRTHRDDSRLEQDLNPQKTQYGAQQLDWLKQSLLQFQQSPQITFKIVATGNQFLETNSSGGESANEFRRERREILDFIRDEKITGVLFLTGDIHTTILQKHLLPGLYPLYDLTTSPLTSGISQTHLAHTVNDPNRVEGTVVPDQNFCRLDVSGPRDQRRLTIRCFDKTNLLRWTHTLTATDLTFSANP